MRYDKLHNWKNYIIIGLVSIIALLFFPMLGSTTDLALNLPNTKTGWVVYLVSKASIAAVNIVIFHSFMEQAKINIRDNPKYIEANEIMGKVVSTKYQPKSPEKWSREQYLKKGTTVIVTSMLGCISLTQAVLAFDLVTMLTYLSVIVGGLIFGVIQMSCAEAYWTGDYWQYAKLLQKKLGLAKGQSLQQTNDTLCNSRGIDFLESADSAYYSSVID